MKKIILLILSITLCASVFSSCSRKSFDAEISCQELANSLKKEISVPEGEFEEYSLDELRFLFSSTDLYDDICIIYSTDSTDVCELGVIHSSNEENAKRLYEEARGYIKSMQEEKSEFLRNYSPNELSKLNSADARRYGEYIIFTVADQTDRDTVLKEAEALLSK